MTEGQLITAVLAAVISFLLGYWLGKVHEKGRQCDLRLSYSESEDFNKLPSIEKSGALAMWKWLRENT